MIMYLKKFGSCIVLGAFILMVTFSCVPKEKVVFRGVQNVSVEPNEQNQPILKADAFFHNPNSVKMKLKEIYVDVMVNGKPTANVRQKMKVVIPPKSDFSVPVEALLSMKELGLLDTIVNLLGGKKYDLQYTGYVKIAVHGVTIKVPFTHQEQIRLRL